MTALASPQVSGGSGLNPPDGMVNTENVASLPKENKRSAKKMAKWFWEQYQNGLTLRRPHAISWIKVKSIMRGIHYFQISRDGAWRPLKAKPGQIWAAIPLMKPYYRQELGRLTSNVLGVTTKPARADSEAIQRSDRAYNILTHWLNEVQVPTFFDRAAQILLYEGMVGFSDPFPDQNSFPFPLMPRALKRWMG